MTKGSQPTDGGNLLLTEKEAQEFTESYPDTASLVHRFMGSSEFLNNKKRYCCGYMESILVCMPGTGS